MTGHIKILNDPVELVPLLITFNNAEYKKIYDLLNKAWMTEDIEEQWRMPKPGEKPTKEYRATYSKFRASFQCSMGDIGDLLHIAISNDESLRSIVDAVQQEIMTGTTSIGDISRKYGVSPIFIKGLAKRIPGLDVRGQGMVLLDRTQ